MYLRLRGESNMHFKTFEFAIYRRSFDRLVWGCVSMVVAVARRDILSTIATVMLSSLRSSKNSFRCVDGRAMTPDRVCSEPGKVRTFELFTQLPEPDPLAWPTNLEQSHRDLAFPCFQIFLASSLLVVLVDS